MDPQKLLRRAHATALAGEDQCWRCLEENRAVLDRVIDGHLETAEEQRIARLAAGLVRLMLLRRNLPELRMNASQDGPR